MMEKTPVMFNDGGRGTVARMTLAQTTTTAAPDGGASGLADLLAATLPTDSRLVVAWSDVRIDGGPPHTGTAPHARSARARGCMERLAPHQADAAHAEPPKEPATTPTLPPG